MPIFQSTLPYGSERKCQIELTSRNISIHAPLRERGCCLQHLLNLSNFNPRSLTGAQDYPGLQSLRLHFNPRSLTGASGVRPGEFLAIQFQSTLPYGSESLSLKPRGMQEFQSTLPYGSAVWYSIYKHNKAISIHAPLWERASKQITSLLI